ncbi:MAG: ribonuclease Y [Candidatus Poribacteria bacterium]|nr:MAG: ribonuclease Y [Candidatus Poribacteria bacterium]
MGWLFLWIGLAFSAGIGAGVGVKILWDRLAAHRARRLAGAIVEEAYRQAEAIRKEAQLLIKDELLERRQELEAELQARREQLERLEDRIRSREEQVLNRQSHQDRREEELDQRQAQLEHEAQRQRQQQEEIAQQRQEYIRRLAEVAQMSVEAARRQLLAQVAVEARHDAAQVARKVEQEMRRSLQERARMILATAIERCAGEFIAEKTGVAVTLPSEEMKGRIIGREGRNIRAFELYAGVDLIIDETPETIVISSYDPRRRDIARRALEALIADGRIHPARIEQALREAEAEVDRQALQRAQEIVEALHIGELPEEILQMLARLRYRTSHGQNVLEHSREVALIAGSLAAELGMPPYPAKRAGLLHDIGKATEQYQDGDHVAVGVNLLRKYGEDPEVLHAIEAHHEAVEPRSALAVLLIVADRVSAARPGARRDSLEQYVRRLRELEAIAKSFPGVEEAYAIHAGRELRVIVQADALDDDDAYLLSKEIARRIQAEVRLSGPVQVTVIREVRATAHARP